MAGRRKPQSDDSGQQKLDRSETDKLICYRYAQCRNASAVGKEFGVSRMRVTRAWERLSDDERQALVGTSEQVDEELNQRIIDAERIAGDRFVRRVVEIRDRMSEELVRRVTGNSVQMISDKDFASLFRLVANLSVAVPADEANVEEDTFRRHRESIRADIETPKEYDHDQ